MTRATYTGHDVLTFQDYMDMEAGKTLTAEPGVTYDVAPASGRLVPDLPAGWFVPEDPEAESAEQEAGRLAAESVAGEGADAGEGPAPDDAEHPDEPQQQEGGEPQQF